MVCWRFSAHERQSMQPSLLCASLLIFALPIGAGVASCSTKGMWQDGATRPSASGSSSNAVQRKSTAMRLPVTDPLIIRLDPLVRPESFDDNQTSGALKVGTGRGLPHAYSGDIAPQLRWQDQLKLGRNGALVAFIELTSPGAAGLRVGLRFLAAQSVDLHFAGESGSSDPLPSFKASARHLELDETPVRWSPTVDGDTLTIRIAAPSRSAADSVRLAIDRVSHIHSAVGE